MGKIKYPKYTKAESNAHKLTDPDIVAIRKARAGGVTIRALASKYGVHIDTIAVWTDEAYRQKKRAYQKEYCRLHPRTKEQNSESMDRFRKRKKELKPTFRGWQHQRNKECPYYVSPTKKQVIKRRTRAREAYQSDLEKGRQLARNRRNRRRDHYNEKQREWRRKNPEKTKQYSKTYRDKKGRKEYFKRQGKPVPPVKGPWRHPEKNIFISYEEWLKVAQ